MTVSNPFKKKFDGFSNEKTDSSKAKSLEKEIVDKEIEKVDGRIIYSEVKGGKETVNLRLQGPKVVQERTRAPVSNQNNSMNSNSFNNTSSMAPVARSPAPSPQRTNYKVAGPVGGMGASGGGSTYSSPSNPPGAVTHGTGGGTSNCCNMARSGGVRRCMTCPYK